MEVENRPNAALVNKEWWESARKVLSYEEQGQLLIEAVEYVLYGIGRTMPKGKVGIVFEMVRPALDSDVAKYRERCARNAANARSGRERVAASGSEWVQIQLQLQLQLQQQLQLQPHLSLQRSRERGRGLLFLGIFGVLVVMPQWTK